MKSIKAPLILFICLVVTSTAMAPSFAGVKPKSAGRTATSIPNTILSGKGAPTSALGINGDFYIDTRSLAFYGPKKTGKWPVAQSLQGAAGADGSNGKNGSDGKSTVNASNNTSNNAGPAGPAGPSGPSGAQGEKGDAGLPGASGSAGASGLPGAPGSAGAQGLKGDPGTSGGGTPGAKGDTGSTGLTGAKGETGTVGLTGPSSVFYGTITVADISGSAGSAQSGVITGFQAGKSYLLKIKIVTYQPGTSLDNSMPLGFVVSTIGGTPIILSQTYSVAKGNSFRNSVGPAKVEYSIDSEVMIDGSTSIDYSLGIQIEAGKSTATSDALKILASFSATLVGSVSAL